MLDHISRKAGTRTPRRAHGVLLACLLAFVPAAAADAAKPRKAKVRATATITSCKGENVGLAYSLRGDRKVRGATLRVSAVLYPLFGAPRPATKVIAKRKTRLIRSVGFPELTADTWSGIVRYRWKRGRKTVAFGSVRTSRARVGRRRGRAFCTLPIGRRPVDTVAPFVTLLPDTAEWLRGPVDLTFLAFDDLSGIQGVFSSVNGGAPVTGRTRTLSTEGAHTIEYAARDVAGNTSPLKRGVVRVDTAAPTAPGLIRPASVTGRVQPTVTWSASTDSGSGVRSYVVAIRNPAGGLVSAKRVGAETTSTTVDDVLAPGSYTAEVYAVDGTTPEPFVTGSGARQFEVRPGSPQVTGTTPGGGEIIPLANAGSDLVVGFDRPMDAGSVGGAVTLHRIAPNAGQITATVSCPGDCTQATVDPSSTIGEGVYELRISTGARSEEGDPLAASHTSRFSVPIYEESFEGGGCGATFSPSQPWGCRTGGPLPTRHLAAPVSQINRTVTTSYTVTSSSLGAPAADGVPGAQVRLRRAFTKTSGCANDQGQALVRLGNSIAAQATYAATAPDAVQTIDFAFDGQPVTLRFVLQVDACGQPSQPVSGLDFAVDEIQVARKP